MTTPLYKWLLADNTTPVQKKSWPCPLGEWTAHETPILCESGWHGVEAKDVLEHLPKVSTPPVLYEVEARGVLLHGDDKFSCESMRLVRRVGAADMMLLVKFALVCAESSLGNFEKVFPNDPRVRDCIDVTWRFTRGEATAQEVETASGGGEVGGGVGVVVGGGRRRGRRRVGGVGGEVGGGVGGEVGDGGGVGGGVGGGESAAWSAESAAESAARSAASRRRTSRLKPHGCSST